MELSKIVGIQMKVVNEARNYYYEKISCHRRKHKSSVYDPNSLKDFSIYEVFNFK